MRLLRTILVAAGALLALSAGVQAVGDCETPLHLRLSLTGEGDGKSMAVGWTVDGDCDQYNPAVFVVPDDEFGRAAIRAAKLGDFSKLQSSDDCLTKIYRPKQTHYYCTLRHLTPNTRYLYIAGNTQSTISFSENRSFRTPPAAGATGSMVVLGDLGLAEGDATADALAEVVAKEEIGLAVHVGDLSYADAYDLDGANPEYESITDDFMALLEPSTRGAPYMVLPGNRDVTCHFDGDHDCAPHTRNFTAFQNRWHMPSRTTGGPGDSNMWYTYSYGDVQFISINTESNFPRAPYNKSTPASAGEFVAPQEQLVWLEKTLARANSPAARKIRPWVVVVGHRPLYTTLTLDFPADEIIHVRAAFEELFVHYGVNLYLSGHAHMYERTFPMANFEVETEDYLTATKPVYVVNGAAGNIEGHCDDVTETIPSYVPYRNIRQYGYGLIETYEGDAATRVVSNAAVPAQGDVQRRVRADGAVLYEADRAPAHPHAAARARARATKQAEGNGEEPRVLCYSFVATTVDTGKKLDVVDKFCLSRGF